MRGTAPAIREPRTSEAHVLTVALSIVLSVVLLFLTACTTGKTPAPQEADDSGAVEDSGAVSAHGGRIRYGLTDESAGWNPTTTVWEIAGREVSRAIFDTLTAFDADSVAQPNLAESLTHNDDYLTWTITLRDGVVLHNGRAVDAEVVAENLEGMRSSELFGPTLAPIAAISVTGPRTVTVAMQRPWVTFPDLLTTQIGIVADPDWLRSGDPSGPIGTGPFRFASWSPWSSLVVERNESWWRSDDAGGALPYLDRIEFIPIPDDNARAARLSAGDLDLMQTTSGDGVTRFDSHRTNGRDSAVKYQVFTDSMTESSETFIQLNTAVAPFDDPEARTAIALATDPKDFVASIEADHYEPATGPFSTESPWYFSVEQPGYDRRAAEEAIASVKATHDEAFSFVILVPPVPHVIDAARWFQDRWRKLGIDSVIEITPDRTVYDDRVATGDYQATIRSGFGSPSPFIDAMAWHPSALPPLGEPSLNTSRIDDPDLAIALDEASASPDPDRQAAFVAVVQQRLTTDSPFIWLFHGIRGVIARPELVNVANWTLPDGAKGLTLDSGTNSLFQIWTTG